METIIDFLFYAFLSSAIFLLLLIGGEYIAMFYPNSGFTKWWRKHIVDQYPYNDDKF